MSAASAGPTLNPWLDHIIDHFILSLDDDARRHCKQFYVGCLAQMIRDENHEALRYNRHDLFIRALHFVTRPRSDEELEVLKDRLSSPCKCDKTLAVSQKMHEVRSNVPITFSLVLDQLCLLLTYCFVAINGQLVTLDSTRKRAGKEARKGHDVAWPVKTSDIFVYSPQAIFSSFWKLYNKSDSLGVIICLEAFLTAAGSTFSSQVTSLGTSFPADWARHLERMLNDPSFDPDLSCRAISALISIVSRSINEAQRANMDFFRPEAHKMIFLLTKSYNLFSSLPPTLWPDTPLLITVIESLGAAFWQTFSPLSEVSGNRHLYSPAFVERAAMTPFPAGMDCIRVSFDEIQHLIQSDACQAPGCNNTHATQNRRFAVCAGCSVVSYCSRECQTKAWKDSKIQHKKMCKTMGVYKRRFKIDWKKVPENPTKEDVYRWTEEAGISKEAAEGVLVVIKEMMMTRFGLL